MDNFLKELANIAPAIGGLFGGPVGGVVGLGVKALARAITGTTSEQDALEALKTNPDLLAQLIKQANELAHEQLKLYIQDTQNARQQTVELAKAGSVIAWGPVILSMIILAGFFVNSYYIFLIVIWGMDIKENIFQVMLIMQGTLMTMAGQVANYWLGSSKGSSDKTDALMEAIKGARKPA